MHTICLGLLHEFWLTVYHCSWKSQHFFFLLWPFLRQGLYAAYTGLELPDYHSISNSSRSASQCLSYRHTLSRQAYYFFIISITFCFCLWLLVICSFILPVLDSSSVFHFRYLFLRYGRVRKPSLYDRNYIDYSGLCLASLIVVAGFLDVLSKLEIMSTLQWSALWYLCPLDQAFISAVQVFLISSILFFNAWYEVYRIPPP